MLVWSGGDSGRCSRRARILCSAAGGPAGTLFSQERVKLSSPWSKLPLTSAPVFRHPQWPRRPKSEHSLALSKTLQAVTEVAAPAAAASAGSHPCPGQPGGDRPSGMLPWPCLPALPLLQAPGRGAELTAASLQPREGTEPLGDMGTHREQPPATLASSRLSLTPLPMPAPVCGQSWGCSLLPSASPGAGMGD